jgi:hypothetical protein
MIAVVVIVLVIILVSVLGFFGFRYSRNENLKKTVNEAYDLISDKFKSYKPEYRLSRKFVVDCANIESEFKHKWGKIDTIADSYNDKEKLKARLKSLDLVDKIQMTYKFKNFLKALNPLNVLSKWNKFITDSTIDESIHYILLEFLKDSTSHQTYLEEWLPENETYSTMKVLIENIVNPGSLTPYVPPPEQSASGHAGSSQQDQGAPPPSGSSQQDQGDLPPSGGSQQDQGAPPPSGSSQ